MNDRQQKKEATIQLALSSGLVVFRRDLDLVGITLADGQINVLKTFDDFDDFWANAYEFVKNSNNALQDSHTHNIEKLIIHTDGGSRGNPGKSAGAFVLQDENGHVIDEGGEFLGITNSAIAEYKAVELALKKSLYYKPRALDIFVDNLMLANHMNGINEVKNKELWPIHDSIKALLAGIESVRFIHVKRESNKEADAKVNQILDHAGLDTQPRT